MSPWLARNSNGINVACGESAAPTATRRPLRSAGARTAPPARTTISEVRSRSVSRMQSAWTRLSGRRGDAFALQPGQRRVPCHGDLAGEVRLHLAFIVGEQHEIEVQAVAGKVSAEPIPDRNDLGIVGDRAKNQRLVVLRSHSFKTGSPCPAWPGAALVTHSPVKFPMTNRIVAERGGFEPPRPFRVYTLSRRAP